MHGGRAEPFHSALNNNPFDATCLVLGPNHSNVSKWRIGNPHFCPVQNHMIAVFFEVRRHPAGIRSVIRLGQTETSHHFARCQLGQKCLLLLL